MRSACITPSHGRTGFVRYYCCTSGSLLKKSDDDLLLLRSLVPRSFTSVFFARPFFVKIAPKEQNVLAMKVASAIHTTHFLFNNVKKTGLAILYYSCPLPSTLFKSYTTSTRSKTRSLHQVNFHSCGYSFRHQTHHEIQ